MIPCVTISLLPQAKGGPFIFWDDLRASAEKAAALGFPAIEVFAPDAASIPATLLEPILKQLNLRLAALGTGGGWVRHRLTLTSADSTIRQKALAFIHRMIDAAEPFNSSVIVGSMQGRHDNTVNKDQALNWLAEGLRAAADYAAPKKVPILYEPLNRYETNLLNRLDDVLPFIRSLKSPGVKILADLFHMNIEESSLPEALLETGDLLGHLHFVDSNRRPAGLGHIDFTPIFHALGQIGYKSYISAEALPFPDPQTAAAKSLETFQRLIAGK
jgi:sugar phosphate isomerase/epimerase